MLCMALVVVQFPAPYRVPPPQAPPGAIPEHSAARNSPIAPVFLSLIKANLLVFFASSQSSMDLRFHSSCKMSNSKFVNNQRSWRRSCFQGWEGWGVTHRAGECTRVCSCKRVAELILTVQGKNSGLQLALHCRPCPVGNI